MRDGQQADALLVRRLRERAFDVACEATTSGPAQDRVMRRTLEWRAAEELCRLERELQQQRALYLAAFGVLSARFPGPPAGISNPTGGDPARNALMDAREGPS